ncbi:ATP-binding cassette domain-containing protein [Streptomyces decoyicus]|uniref:ATP-binding cassette domain-containing protein n=1 Tax=Streptomyces decoyicus TaxID=249567 RepID=UPI003F4AFA73
MTLRAGSGRLVGLVGPNGSGKSTLLRRRRSFSGGSFAVGGRCRARSGRRPAGCPLEAPGDP